jgi:hypothetical protein
VEPGDLASQYLAFVGSREIEKRDAAKGRCIAERMKIEFFDLWAPNGLYQFKDGS